MISHTVADFLAADPSALVAQLNVEDTQRFRGSEPQQLRAWAETLRSLHSALADWPEAAAWRLLLEYDIQRLGRRIDAVLVTPRAVLVLEFKTGASLFTNQDRAQVEDYAIDLQDFHPLSPRQSSERGEGFLRRLK
jgi:Ser/Thr protein kinase RdoA (MazF antagonist)